jgi:hypothetical protein
MDAFTVQQHIADWLENGGIAGLDKVWAALPDSTGINFANYGEGEMRCQAVVYVEDDPEIRRSIGGANPYRQTPAVGMKWLTYNIRIEFVHRSADPSWIAADQALKQTIVAGARTMIRADPTLGSSTLADPLFASAGEGRMGIRGTYEPPFVDQESGEREQWAYLAFQVNAWVTG